MKVQKAEQLIFFLQAMSRGCSYPWLWPAIVVWGTRAFFPCHHKWKMLLTFSVARIFDAPRPSNSVLTTHGIVLVQMHFAGSEGKTVSGEFRKGRKSKRSKRYYNGAREQFIYQWTNVLEDSDFGKCRQYPQHHCPGSFLFY